ncbi:TIGR00725 family protein [Gloeocapsopsis sp. IPPAS B-1203]|uniref:TIGR00725 family protein n=1 Tax=Gloeocapsopsis sp. IPPAS B-1203 TaxID=2049454 RepID=UPI000C193489|nr:TIGR00725 family protein [Gloeocapsopsis sp. IPPAS B-1203]PIG91293.1 TIGR00725 family protein [Gloeocapsopsis sp. IPPAS B-1203]
MNQHTRKTIIGVMGPGEQATTTDLQNAYQLGYLIAQQGWILLTGGRNVGVMEAANQGAKAAQGLTVGILPGNDTSGVSPAVDIAIITDMGNARNNINVLSSDVVIACGMGAGTASEIALAIKSNKPVILLNDDINSNDFFQKLAPKKIDVAQSVNDAIALTQNVLVSR